MRVLHVMDLMSVGGAQVLVKGIFEEYQNPDHFLFVLRKSDDLIEVNHPNVFYADTTKKYSLSAIFGLKRMIKENKIDVIHAYLLKSQIFARLLKQFYFRKTTLIFHELGEIFMNEKRWYIRFMKSSRRFVDLYLAASDATKKELQRKINIPAEKIIPLYNFLILRNLHPEKISIDIKSEKEKLGVKNSDFTIGYAGRLSPEKGPVDLITALPMLRHPFRLLIAGTGNQKSLLESKLMETNLLEKVEFLGFRKDMLNVYALLDLLVIPSEHESFGLVAVEAMSMGIPVLASDVPGLNEVVKEEVSGFQFESRNPKSLAEKLNFIIEHPEKRTQIIENAKLFVQNYDIKTYYNNMLKAYDLAFKNTSNHV